MPSRQWHLHTNIAKFAPVLEPWNRQCQKRMADRNHGGQARKFSEASGDSVEAQSRTIKPFKAETSHFGAKNAISRRQRRSACTLVGRNLQTPRGIAFVYEGRFPFVPVLTLACLHSRSLQYQTCSSLPLCSLSSSRPRALQTYSDEVSLSVQAASNLTPWSLLPYPPTTHQMYHIPAEQAA